MELRTERLDPILNRLDALVASVLNGASTSIRTAGERWRNDASATRYHSKRFSEVSSARSSRAEIVVILGGTGTGKSTLVNRLLGANVSAASFRRTFTAGAVAIARDGKDVPANWLGLPHVSAESAELPVKGQIGSLVIVPFSSETAPPATLVDTPDLDGDQPAHHTQADRAFRWADRVLFLVTPEKYQMTELLPYYRLAARYGVGALYVMNKCEEDAVLDDYRRLLVNRIGEGSSSNVRPSAESIPVFAIGRDDAAYDPPASANLDSLKTALSDQQGSEPSERSAGLRHRVTDVAGRLNDQVIAPLREARRSVDVLIGSVLSLEAPVPGVDVNPITQQLRRRLQERSILYLMGPQRILDRVRQAPSLLVRLPRVAWDYVMKGEVPTVDAMNPTGAADGGRTVPDFRSILMDQFAVLHSRIDDVLRETPAGNAWLSDPEASTGYAGAKMEPSRAGDIADEELRDLKTWLERKWNATPRDTKMIETLLKYLPGGKKLSRWTEAAPYLLTIAVVTHHAFFGHIDLMVLGGYGLATWLTEKISNEVAGRTRAANARIAERYARLAHEQIRQVCDWLNERAPSLRKLEELESAANELEQAIGGG